MAFHQVLGRDDHEGSGQRVLDAVSGYLVLAHGFQQRRLSPRSRPVYLVGQHDIGEDRPWYELEPALPQVEDRRPGNVAGQQVRRKLNPGEPPREGLGYGLGQQGFTDTRKIL